MNKRVLIVLICVSVLLCGVSCNKGANQTGNTAGAGSTDDKMPEDFSFSIIWNVCGDSSYDSQTGKLVKSYVDVKYTTYLNMTEEELRTVYRFLFDDIDITEYPDTYDPFNAPDAENKFMSAPDQTIIITATANGITKTVSCESIALGTLDDCYCDEARAFLTAKNNIVDLITASPEWEDLPELEFGYD